MTKSDEQLYNLDKTIKEITEMTDTINKVSKEITDTIHKTSREIPITSY